MDEIKNNMTHCFAVR